MNRFKCTNCGQEIISEDRTSCLFCGYNDTIQISDVQDESLIENIDNENSNINNESYIDNQENQESFMFHYIISLFIPFMGLLIGSILLTKDDNEKVDAGKICVIWGILSIIISYFILDNI